MDSTLDRIIKTAEAAAGVPFERSPGTRVGEKAIWSASLGEYDGEWEVFHVSIRFISGSVETAFARAEAVSKRLCTPGNTAFYTDNGSAEFVIRTAGGGSGFIGRTGHYYILSRFEVRRRMSSIPYAGTESVIQ